MYFLKHFKKLKLGNFFFVVNSLFRNKRFVVEEMLLQQNPSKFAILLNHLKF